MGVGWGGVGWGGWALDSSRQCCTKCHARATCFPCPPCFLQHLSDWTLQDLQSFCFPHFFTLICLAGLCRISQLSILHFFSIYCVSSQPKLLPKFVCGIPPAKPSSPSLMPFNKSEWWWLVGLGLGMGMGMGDGDGWVGGWVGGHWTLLDNNAPNALPGPLFSMATILFATSG